MLALKLSSDPRLSKHVVSRQETATVPTREVTAQLHSPAATILVGGRTLEPARLAELAATLRTLGSDAETAAYTFFCEAVANVFDHAYGGHTPQDSPELWRAAAEIDTASGRLLLTVTDNGGGIPRSMPRLDGPAPPESNQTAFADHERLAGALRFARQKTTGRGQGLSWFLRLAERWQGRLVIESLGGACVFNPGQDVVATAGDVFRHGTLVQIEAPLTSVAR